MTTSGPGWAATSEPDRAARVVCPWCHRDDTERLSAWGSFLSVVQYYCRSCRTVFDVVRDGGEGL
ncbi:MAG: hypothetical protein NZ742_10965 [Acidobacteria bacterium]|nr:hypothetical protein [Acidobacteriota bacterium]MDW7985217.1 hypothetical protein [Acidobacteriota bacterium]